MKADNPLTTRFIEHHPVSAARSLEHVSQDSVVLFLESIEASLACLLMRYFMSDYAAQCLMKLSDDLLSECAEQIPVDVCRIMLQLNSEQRQHVIERMSGSARKQILQRMDYPAGAVGTAIKTDCLIFSSGLTVSDVLKRIEKLKRIEGYRLNVVDENHKLLGSLGTAKLLSADKNAIIDSLLSKQKRPHVLVTAYIEEMLNHPGWISNRQLPVVDRNGVYLGELDYETVVSYLQESSLERKPLEPFGSMLSLAGIYWLSVSWIFENLFSNKRNDSRE